MFKLKQLSTLVALSSLLALPAVQAEQPNYNQVSLRAEASQEIPHDVMRVTLFHEAQDADPAKLSQTISQALNAATSAAQKIPTIKVSTGNRHSYAIQDKDAKQITGWRERGEIILESHDFAALSALTGELLGTLNMSDLSFAISKSARLSHEDQLMQQAISAFNARAKIATEALGGKSYRLINLNLDGGGYQPVFRMQRSEMAMKASAAPEVAAGSSQVSMSASGTIEIQLP